MTRLVLLLLLATMLAGCAEDAASGSLHEPQGPPELRVNATATEAAPPEADAAPKPSVVERIAWDGEAPAAGYACIIVAELPCATTGRMFVTYPLPRANWTHAMLNLSWNPALPGQELGIGVYGCAPGCEDIENLGNWTSGPSPLVYDMPLDPASPEYPEVFVFVWSDSHHYQDPVLLFANPKQPFHLEGEVHGVRHAPP